MKNKKVIIISSVITIALVVAIVIGVLYFTTDLFKTEQQLFYKYLAQTKVMDSNFVEQCKVANDKIAKNSNSSSASLDFLISTPNQETGSADIQKILSVQSNGLENDLLKQSYRDFTFSSNDQNFLTLKYIKDDNVYGIFADNILAKYLAVENANLKDLFTKLGVEDTTKIPDSIQTINYEELLKIDEVTLNQLKETYGTLIYNNIKEDNFYKIVNADKTEIIGVTLSEQETSNLLKAILETVKNDNLLLNLIINKAQLIGYNDITLERIQTEIQKYIDKINSQTYSDNDEFINLSFVKKDNSVIKLMLMINEILETEDMMLEDGSKVNLPEINTLTIEVDISENQKVFVSALENDVELFKSAINYSWDNNNISFNIELESKEGEETNYIKAQYKTDNYQTDNIIQNIVIDMNSNNEEKYQINLLNNITLKQDVQISKLTTENSVKLNDMTSEQLEKLFIALENRINQLYGESLTSLYSNSIINRAQEAQKEYKEAIETENRTIQSYQNMNN